MALRAPTFKTQLVQDSLGIRELTREEAQRRAAEEKGTAKTMRAWALLVPERGVQLNLDDFPYQREWYSDEIANAREVCWQKAAQVGMSAYAWRWAARRAEQFGDSVIYFFPTDDDVSDFGDQRIEPSIQESAYLLRRIPASYVRHKHLKQIGSGWLALRGTQSRSAVQSVDADALVFDEYNYLHPGNVAHAERRIAGSKAAGRFPRIRRFGYPTIAGAGISSYYDRSDRRQWHVTCPECGLEQTLEWSANMRWRTFPGGPVCRMGRDDYEDYRVVAQAWRACRDCEASLEPAPGERFGPIHAGRWQATNPGSDLIGYHASRLIVPRTDLVELVQNSRKTSPTDQEVFWNNDMGLPYSPAEAALTDADVDGACSFGLQEMPSGYRGRNTVVAGVDVASERDLTMWVDELMPDGTARALYLGEPKDFQEVAELIRRYRVNFTVCDGLPERRQARALAMTFPGRVVIAAYDDNDRADAFKFDPKKNLVTINRTEAIDAFMDSIRQQRRHPLQKPPRRFKSQLLSPKRRTEEKPSGKKVRVYRSTGPDGDDYTHAGVYVLVAQEMWALRSYVENAMASAQGEVLANERLGFRQPQIDDYDPGLQGM